MIERLTNWIARKAGLWRRTRDALPSSGTTVRVWRGGRTLDAHRHTYRKNPGRTRCPDGVWRYTDNGIRRTFKLSDGPFWQPK